VSLGGLRVREWKNDKLMPIIVTLDVMLARRKMRSRDLAQHVGITEQNISLLKSGRVRGVRFDTLERICQVLECQPGDILEFRPDAPSEDTPLKNTAG
jgi:putative transcriptional regulator